MPSSNPISSFINEVFEGLPNSSFPINLRTDEEGCYITAELPGLIVSTIDVSVKGKELSIKACRKKAENSDESMNYLLKERQEKDIEEIVHLDKEVNVDEVKATYIDGILSVTMPVAQKEKAHKIVINCSKADKES